ncbi:MAG TPA: tetratricopeptide repeat protein [Planctomycetota bacterium]|nr:tetratricopeptide repeat protein [Planctomycetota bacterium]
MVTREPRQICTALLLAALLAGSLRAGEPENAVIAPPESLLDQVIELNRIHEPELDAVALRTEFNALVEKARTALTPLKTPQEKVAALNKVLLTDRKVAYLSNKYWRDATLAASVLRAQGNCLSTSTLYVLIGKALDLPIKMVLVPRHAYARWDDGTVRINIETTYGGAELPDAHYLSGVRQPAPDDIEKLGWGRSLTDTQVIGELHAIAAGHRTGESRIEDAIVLLEKAIAAMPERRDLELRRYRLMSTLPGRRLLARQKVIQVLQDGKNPLPSGVQCDALVFLAQEAAAEGDYQQERTLLLGAFARAPKSDQLHVLSSLAFCHRSMKDYRGAVRYMELASALDPDNDSTLYNLAILQKNDGRLDDALTTIRRARKINPESWNLHIMEAGYLIFAGKREEGMKLYETLEKPRADVEFWEIMQTWFMAASQQREKFYTQFERALSLARSPRILEWIEQDPDLDVYRNETEFKDLVAKHRPRLLQEGEKK